MPAVPINTRDQYIRAIEVLDRVGGTWQGVGQDERYLLVTPAQYQALVDAEVVDRNGKESRRGKKSRKAAKP